jgi:hypothetical protein
VSSTKRVRTEAPAPGAKPPAKAVPAPARKSELPLETLRDHISELVKKNPDKAAIILTEWASGKSLKKTG